VSTGVWALLAALGVGTVIGLVHRARDGRIRRNASPPEPSAPATSTPTGGSHEAPAGPGDTTGPGTPDGPGQGGPQQTDTTEDPGSVGTALPRAVRELLDEALDREDAERPSVVLVQLSTTFCAPCRHARVLLSDLAGRVTGLAHVELDLTRCPEVAEQLRVFRTPTTLALDAHGHELLRVSGVPRRDALLDALRPFLPEAAASGEH